MEAWDVIKPSTDPTRVPASGNLPITAIVEPTTCTVGGTFPCDLGPGGRVIVQSDTYVIQSGDPDPLPDQANATVVDLCDGTPSNDCPEGIENQLQFASVTALFQPSISVDKSGPDVAKAGDTITYEVLVTDTSSSDTPELSCTANDSLAGNLGAVVPGTPTSYDFTIPAGASGSVDNTVTVTCSPDGFDNEFVDSDTHVVDLIEPAISVSKTGPASSKVGDTVTYTIGFTNTGSGDLENCTGNDTVIGALGAFEAGVNRTFDHTVTAGDPDPLVNTATITCDVVGFDNQVSDDDSHSVDLIDPAITVSKTGPASVKIGDEACYDIGFTNTGTGAVESCSGTDTVIGALGAFEAGVTRQFCRTVQAGDPNPLVNVATITCDVVGFDNQVSDSDDHSADLIDPAITVTKTGPASAKIGDEACYDIGFTNTGTGALENCSGTDTVIGALGAFEAGVTRQFCRTVEAGDPNPLDNVATITCDVVGFDNQVSDEDDHSVDLIDPAIEVTKSGPDTAKAGDEICYDIGFASTGTGALENCTGNDTVIGALGAFEAGVNRSICYTVQAGDPNPLVNVATITCDVVGFDNQVSDDDDHSVDLIDPAITVSKTGPASSKVGDTVTYTIGFTNTGSGNVENCTGNDTVIGALGAFEAGVDRTFDYTVTAGDPNPLVNVATITCDVVGFDNQVSDEDDHSVDLIDPAIEVTKSGPDTAKVGDEICYDIGFTNTGTGALENCTGDDTVIGALGAFESGVNRSICYTVQAGDPDPLDNVATITCDVVGFDNQVSDSADHSVDLVNPAVSLAKECRPDPVLSGEEINWAITVTNDGDTDLDCLVNDAEAGLVDEAVSVAVGGNETVNASRIVVDGDAPVLSNTADVACTIAGATLPNEVSDEASADCEVQVEELFCRTPGFWGSRAGDDKRRSTDLTQHVINAAGGSLSICGQTIDNTDVGNVHSATEAMCVRIEGLQQRQLARQLTAMALNCVVSGGGADCSDTSVAGLFADANAACTANNTNLSSWIGQVDAFNNGVDSDCNETDFSESDVFDGISPLPGPAGGSSACRAANGNGWKVVPAPGGETP